MKESIFNTVIHLILLCVIVLVFNMCANISSPTGGPRDTQSPILIKSTPALYTKNFNSDKVRLYFNEFVILQDINNQVIISPPLDENPEFKIRGKSVIIEFNENFNENSTYSIFLGNGIADLTENNPLSNFSYVFSTGNILDSLTINGNVKNAFDLQSEEGINVMLYLDNNDTIPFDSVPYFIKPWYIAKTDADGNFIINNLPDKEFKIFVLKDVNSNLIFDQPNEEIAFLDSLIRPYYIKKLVPDTISPDSLVIDTLNHYFITNEINPDSILYEDLLTDSLQFEEQKNEPFQLVLFNEVDSTQKFMKATLAKQRQLLFIFKFPVTDIQIKPININTNLSWKIVENNSTRDTITYWIKNLEQDTLVFEISDQNEILDTVEVALVKKKGKKKTKEEDKPKKLGIDFNISGNSINLNEPLEITFSYPVSESNYSGILLIESEDTLKPDLVFDGDINRKARIDYNWKESTTYSLIIPDSAFTDILGQTHDSTIRRFSTKSLSDYGNLYIDIEVADTTTNHIIQLFKDEIVLHEYMISEDQRIGYEFLDPGDYKIKVIYDENNNHKWDTGNYIDKLQPERVEYFKSTITIRANWDLEELWVLEY